MKHNFVIPSLLLGAIAIWLTACGSNAPVSNAQPTSVSVASQSSSAASVQSSQVSSSAKAQSTQASNSASAQSSQSARPTLVATQPTAANNPPASGAGALDLLVQAMQAQDNAKSFRLTHVTTSTAGTSKSVSEYVAPDRIHTITTSASGSVTELIAIKGQGSWQQKSGKWTKSPVDMGAVAFAVLDPKNIDEIRSSVDIASLQFVGTELLGTTPTFVYQFNETFKGMGPNGGDLKGSYKAWVGVTDHRIYKQEGDIDSVIKPGTKDHSVTTVEYDINIQIQPPN